MTIFARPTIVAVAALLLSWAITDSFAADKKTKEPPARSYITVYPGSGGTCPTKKHNADAKNNHEQRRIQATFREGKITTTRDFAPGEKRTVSFCNYGKIHLVSAKFLN
ncbi:MAG: hypothetical protein FJ143_08495 [Deltaproteobacteria bacterium]|nr:hypothetical protein [Deltaproteobacteria bacterium]MBM4297764.1 hypothetical protein [Deltaproteobacteria bacterium]